MTLQAGEIVLLQYPFTDTSGIKLRPALIVSADKFNRGEDLIAVPISSRVVPDDAYGFVIAETDAFFPQTGLRCSSAVKWTKPMTISRLVIKSRKGSIPQPVLEAIRAKIRLLFTS